jgi:hypothetical protein
VVPPIVAILHGRPICGRIGRESPDGRPLPSRLGGEHDRD